MEKPLSGGEVLLKKKGKKYFVKLAKDGWKVRREKKKLWEAQQKKKSVKIAEVSGK